MQGVGVTVPADGRTFFRFDIEAVSNKLYRVTKDGGIVVWVISDATIKGSETLTSFRHAIKFVDAGFNLHDTMHLKNLFQG